MNKEDPLSKKIRHIHVVFLTNHILDKLLMFMALLAGYTCLKAIILWQYPTVLFHKYERGLFACLGFYILLQVLKAPPTMKGTLKYLDDILQHSRASSYWQFKREDSEIAAFLIEEINKVANNKLKPLRYYVSLPYGLMVVIIAGLIGMTLFNSLPSSSRQPLQEAIDYNTSINEKILSIEDILVKSKEGSEDIENTYTDIDKKLDSLEKDLLDDLKKTYSKEESLMALTTYDTKKQGLLAQMSSSMDQLSETDQLIVKEELKALGEDDLREKVVDALSNREEQQTMAESKEKSSLQESFTELMSQSEENAQSSSSDNLEIASETTGGHMEESKDGQGGSGMAYKGQAESIEEGVVHREESASSILEDNKSTLQITSTKNGNRHLVYGSDIKTDDSNLKTILGSSGQKTIDLENMSIDIPQGIPENRLHLIQAYYEGVSNE